MMAGFGDSVLEIVYRHFPYFSKLSEKEVNFNPCIRKGFLLVFHLWYNTFSEISKFFSILQKCKIKVSFVRLGYGRPPFFAIN